MTLIGRKVYYEFSGIKVTCTIKATKSAYGRTLYKIVPESGKGSKWTTKVPGEDMEFIDES
jgi:hypothetical protein